MYIWYSMIQTPLSVWLFFEVRKDRQGESEGSGEAREANRKTMQQRHNVPRLINSHYSCACTAGS